MIKSQKEKIKAAKEAIKTPLGTTILFTMAFIILCLRSEGHF